MSYSSWVFLREFRKAFQTTGAIAPSGQRLARAMVEPLTRMKGPRCILEAGPGTGVFSHQLISRLNPGDELILCEINPGFADFISERLHSDPIWKQKNHQVRVECADIRDFFSPSKYDLIVSGLPLNNFDPSFVGELLSGFVESLKPEGVHTYFEYQWVREFRKMCGSRETRARMKGVHDVCQSLETITRVSRKKIYLNLPPAYAYEVKSHI